MPVIEHTTVIQATPAAVFDLISRVEDFSKYTPAIKEIRAVGPNAYRWCVSLAGIELHWEAVVTEATPPSRFSWRSTMGVENTGAFTIVPTNSGTEVRVAMEYRLGSRLFEKILEPVAVRLIGKTVEELLAQVRHRLECEKTV